jgi:hypothetical protein
LASKAASTAIWQLLALVLMALVVWSFTLARHRYTPSPRFLFRVALVVGSVISALNIAGL